MPLTLQLLTPERVVFESDAIDYAVLPSTTGDIGILPGHAPLVTPLHIGPVRLEQGAKTERYAISGGMLEVAHDHIQILAQSAEPADAIDLDRARAAHQRAQERLEQPTHDTDLDRAQAALARALNRLHVGQSAS